MTLSELRRQLKLHESRKGKKVHHFYVSQEEWDDVVEELKDYITTGTRIEDNSVLGKGLNVCGVSIEVK